MSISECLNLETINKHVQDVLFRILINNVENLINLFLAIFENCDKMTEVLETVLNIGNFVSCKNGCVVPHS